MSRSQINLQDAFLNHVRKEKIPVVIHITGGGKIEGLVKGFDNFVILVKQDGQHLIYKHAINSIVPERPVELSMHNNSHPAAESHPAVESKTAGPAAPTGPDEGVSPDSGEPWVEA